MNSQFSDELWAATRQLEQWVVDLTSTSLMSHSTLDVVKQLHNDFGELAARAPTSSWMRAYTIRLSEWLNVMITWIGTNTSELSTMAQLETLAITCDPKIQHRTVYFLPRLTAALLAWAGNYESASRLADFLLNERGRERYEDRHLKAMLGGLGRLLLEPQIAGKLSNTAVERALRAARLVSPECEAMFSKVLGSG